MEAIILAGGKGTRLRPLTLTVPKPMVPIADKPFLYYLLLLLKKEGINRVIFSIGYLGYHIKDYFGENWQGIELEYVIEENPLGTGGAIKGCMKMVNESSVFVVNGDTFCHTNLADMMVSHLKNQADISIVLKEMYNFDRYGTVEIVNNQVKKFNEKKKVKNGFINTGTYCLNKKVFDYIKMPEMFSFEIDFLQNKLSQIKTNAFYTDAYFIDIGIPEDYNRAQHELPKIIVR